ncbi:MAG: hypothetical protein ABIR70_07020 [Bryobacteraceae bacterium]
MPDFSILTEQFALDAADAGLRARRDALVAGQTVVFRDTEGRYVEERPDGRRFEVRLDAGQPRESHRVVLTELVTASA